MITLEKLKIYDSYGGDNDSLERVGRNHEKKLFDNEDWAIISSFYQDIELIKKGLVVQAYIDLTIDKIKRHCDKDSCDHLLTSLPF